MKHLRLFEEHINEIGDASAKPFKVHGPSPRQVVKDMLKAQENRTDNPIDWLDPDRVVKWSFSGDKGTDYEMEIAWTVKKHISRRPKPVKRKTSRKLEMKMNIGFYAKSKPITGTEFNIDDEDDRERTTNLHEQYRILATVVDTAIPVINEASKDFMINEIYIIPKADKGEEESINNRRGRFYLAYLKKAIRKINDKVTISEDKYNGGFVIRGGHISGGGGGDLGYIRNESTVNEIGVKHIKLFEELINEIGDASAKPYKYKLQQKDQYHEYYDFETDLDTKYEVTFDFHEDWTKEGEWTVVNISFGIIEDGYLNNVVVTNEGDIFRVMATIVDMTKKVIKKNKNIKSLEFTGSKNRGDNDRRRNNIYMAYIKKHLKAKNVEDDGSQITVEL
ncbi:MAG: hypothetical protein CMP57_01965 [Flavobacteriales bacterium]|nr:hypothetical protein [Flavobacteriales bacterium]|tara:strand:+ start:3026 stop:4201 length:1176 start_codon:yes stop_codon:yes gene_type:complete